MPRNKYTVSHLGIMDSFWNVIASVSTIAKSILYFVLEEMV